MQSLSIGRGFSFFWVVMILFVGVATSAGADKVSYPGAPATVAEAAKVIDLSTLPLAKGAEKPQHCRIAGLSYKSPGTVKEVYEFHRKQLLDRKWKELPGSFASDQSSNATFARDGFSLSLMVFSTGQASAGKAEEANVTILNHGNVNLDKLPLPPGAKSFYAGPVNAMFLADASVKDTAESCKKLLLGKGWQPYGTAGDTQFFKQNAVRLSALVSAAPAQGGKTMITYATELMSADLPAPAEASNLQYADVTAQLFFDSDATHRELADYYRNSLKSAGWKATTDAPIKIDFKDEMIFRNPEHDMLTLEMTEVESKSRVLLKYQSAAEVAEIEKKVQVEIERRNAEKKKPLPKMPIAISTDATDIEQAKNQIEFKIPSGKAKAVVESWRKRLGNDGWTEKDIAIEDMAGTITFEKGDQRLTLIYADPGFLPAEITFRAIGMDLEKSAEKE
jgi:hypothetical protein